MNSRGIVNRFIGEKLSDGRIADKEAAEALVKSLYDRIGADGTTNLVLDAVRPNEDSMTVVTFRQCVGEVLAPGMTVKLILDKDDQAIGLLSSIMPGIEEPPLDEWAIDASAAEQVVMGKLKDLGSPGTIVEGATEKVFVPSRMHGGASVCAWMVFTSQPTTEGDGLSYTAHYVAADGTYLDYMPVSGLDDPDAATGQSAKNSFDFGAYEAAEMSFAIGHLDGTTEEVTVPVLRDGATGKVYLADARRKVLCADMAAYRYEGELAPIEVQGGADPIDVHTYHTFLRVWDYYESVGWTGPDGNGTPALLLMNYVDRRGNPVENASYMAKINGFQVFSFTRAVDYGECLDVVAHEFTHCVNGTIMTGSGVEGDSGAINEAMGDIMGNIVEMTLDGEDGAWVIAEGLGAEKTYRSMSDPHEYAQPASSFDTFYAPLPAVITKMNDQGGVHINSSLLSILSYKLHQAGMSPKEQGYFWLNMALVMSPHCDYPMLARLLPWVMRQLGYDGYIEALETAIDEVGLANTSDPGIVGKGCGVVSFDFAPIAKAANKGLVFISYLKAPEVNQDKRVNSWPVAGTTVAKANVPEGDYYVLAAVGDSHGQMRRYMVYSESGWKDLENKSNGMDPDAIKALGTTVYVKAGQALEIPNDSFAPVAEKLIREVEEALAS